MKSSQKVVRRYFDSEIFEELKKPSITQSARLHSHKFSITYCYNNQNRNNVFYYEQVFLRQVLLHIFSLEFHSHRLSSSVIPYILNMCFRQTVLPSNKALPYISLLYALPFHRH